LCAAELGKGNRHVRSKRRVGQRRYHTCL
jgi:hypothetical protein